MALSFANVGPSIVIPEQLRGVDPHLVPQLDLPPAFDCETFAFPGETPASPRHKVTYIPGNPEVYLRWSKFPTTSSDLHADGLSLLEESAYQWAELETAGIPVVAHRHEHAGIRLDEQGEPTPMGIVLTATEALWDTETLDPFTHRRHIEPAIATVQGLTTYTQTIFDKRSRKIAHDIFDFSQYNVLPADNSGSVRELTTRNILLDVGLDFFMPTITEGRVSGFLLSSVGKLAIMAMTAHTAARGSKHQRAAHQAVASVATLRQRILSHHA